MCRPSVHDSLQSSVTSFKGLISLEIKNHTSHRANSSSYGDEKTTYTEHLKSNPFAAPLSNLLLSNVHLDWEVYCEWPKSKGSKYSNDVVEEGQEHGYEGCYYDENCPPYQPEEVELVDAIEGDRYLILCCHKVAVWPPLCAPFFYKCK